MTELSDRGVAAFVGAAVGDALGWPQENRSSNVDRTMPSPMMTFRRWRRRGGGRFNAYEETIGSGEYSDDTQMSCAVARSLTKGSAWYDWLTRVELPHFPIYQRGGGKALLAACRAWSAGVAPWQPHRETDAGSYFAAGGNGGAMRVLPHALAAAAADRPVSKADVLRDTVTTHGHPRAVIGALVQAVALRTALTVVETLGYGQLIDALLDDPAAWAALPELDEMPAGWLDAWLASALGDFEQTWQATTEEMTGLLVVARKAIGAGALSDELGTLRELGCTGTKTVGSGTISAAGAVFLASRSAANPRAGLLSAAFLPKADTDTLASMTTSLLAALAGQEWLAPLDREVQDSAYLTNLALEIMSARRTETPPPAPIKKARLERFTKQLDQARPGLSMELVDGRPADVVDIERLTSKTQSSVVTHHRLAVADGQTLHVVRVHRKPRGERGTSDQLHLPVAVHEEERPNDEPAILRVGVKLTVSELNSMQHFYQDVLGMSPTRSGTSFVTFNDIVALTAAARPEPAPPSRLSIYLEVLNIEKLWRRIQEHRVRIVDSLGVEAGRRGFRCLDPEGNVLEIREPSQGVSNGAKPNDHVDEFPPD